MKFKEIYISTDVETDGPIPGKYSMLAIGSVAFSPGGEVLGKFYKKLERLKVAKQDKRTMEFWRKNKKFYREATTKSEAPKKVMNEYYAWLKKMKLKTKTNSYNELIFLGWPLTFDYIFTYWYLIKFVDETKKMHPLMIPFSYNKAIDLNTFVMAHSKKSFRDSLPYKIKDRSWFKNLPTKSLKNHRAIDDALIQGKIFIRILKENQKKK